MIKTKVVDYPVITIHMNPSDKESLKVQAEKNGMQLTTYCRMILLKSLEK
jgi:predicted DNA binding CopG/RHH family protein